MGEREWKSGDVAMVRAVVADGLTNEHRAVRSAGGWLCAMTQYRRSCFGVTEARALVVIDPEDREQVEALCRAHHGVISNQNIGDMQAALRSLIAPPKPEEPTGLGAVVVDENGITFVRAGRLSPEGHFLHDCWRAVDGPIVGDWKRWDRIAAVKVLSEGVTA